MTLDLSHLPDVTNKCYIPLYTNDDRYLIIYGGAGSGKSRFVGQKILFRVLTEKNHRFLITRKVARTMRESVFRLFCNYISQWNLSSLFTINKSEMKISCTNGSELLFMGLDDVEKLKSIEYITGIWVEEASEVSQSDFQQLNLRLRGNTPSYKQIIITFNPISAKHWLKSYFFDEKIESCTIMKSTYKDNEFIDDEYKQLLEEMREKDENHYNIYCLGNWGESKGLIYNNWNVVDTMIDKFDNEMYGIDFGFNHPSSCVHVREYDGEYWIDEILYESNLTNQELIQKLKSLNTNLTQIQGYADSAEPQRIVEFQRAGFQIESANKSVKDGIDFIKSKKLHVTKRSINLIHELNSYKWKESNNQMLLDEPAKYNDHAVDAMRYAIYSENKKCAPKVMTTAKTSFIYSNKFSGY